MSFSGTSVISGCFQLCPSRGCFGKTFRLEPGVTLIVRSAGPFQLLIKVLPMIQFWGAFTLIESNARPQAGATFTLAPQFSSKRRPA